MVWIGANDLSGAYVNCGTWDESDYNNAASSVAQQCGHFQSCCMPFRPRMAPAVHAWCTYLFF